MQFKILIVAVAAATVAADGVSYKMAKKPLGLASLAARQEPGYKPEQRICGDGNTCAEACGSGFSQCPSTSGLSHCYNKDAGETCCMDPSGNACEAGYYCAANIAGDTWCCPEGMSTEECAAKYPFAGPLKAIGSATSSDSTDPTVNPDSSLSNSTDVAASTPQATTEAANDGDGSSGASRFTASGSVAAIIAAAAALL